MTTFEPLASSPILASAAAVPDVSDLDTETTATQTPSVAGEGDLLEDTRDFLFNSSPWYSRYSLGQGNTRIYSAAPDDRDRLLATIVHFTILPNEDSIANGRVMAAAPLLAEALVALLDEWGENERISPETVRRATGAIVAAADGYEAYETYVALASAAEGGQS